MSAYMKWTGDSVRAIRDLAKRCNIFHPSRHPALHSNYVGSWMRMSRAFVLFTHESLQLSFELEVLLSAWCIFHLDRDNKFKSFLESRTNYLVLS